MTVWLRPAHTNTPGPWLFACQVKGLMSVTEGDLTRKVEEDEYAARVEREREEQREEGGWEANDSPKQREGVNGGHRVMRGLNATNAMSQGLMKTNSCIAPKVRARTQTPVQ